MCDEDKNPKAIPLNSLFRDSAVIGLNEAYECHTEMQESGEPLILGFEIIEYGKSNNSHLKKGD